VETGPAGAGIEFGVGTEQFRPTADALVNALVFAIVIPAGERGLGAFLTRDLELFRREDFSPFLVFFVDLVFHGSVSVV
jgi:hypothetical protein